MNQKVVYMEDYKKKNKCKLIFKKIKKILCNIIFE